MNYRVSQGAVGMGIRRRAGLVRKRGQESAGSPRRACKQGIMDGKPVRSGRARQAYDYEALPDFEVVGVGRSPQDL